MAKIVYKDETFRIVDENNLQFQLDIRNAKREQIFTYKYLTDSELIALGFVWSEKSNKWLMSKDSVTFGKVA